MTANKDTMNTDAPRVFTNPTETNIIVSKCRPYKDDKGVKRTPLISPSASYNFHGECIPDPYRPLENIDNGKVQDWIEYQSESTKKLLSSESNVLDLARELKENWTDYESMVHTLNPYGARGGDLFKYDDGQVYGGDFLFMLQEREKYTQLVKKNIYTNTETILLDEKDPHVKDIDTVCISPDGQYIYCKTGRRIDVGTKSHILVDANTGVIIEPQKLDGFECFISWHPSSSGFYYIKDSKLFSTYCFHEIGTAWDDDKCVKELGYEALVTKGDTQFECRHITGGSLLVSVQYKTDYDAGVRLYITSPDNYAELLELKKWKRQGYAFPDIFAVYKGFAYGAIRKKIKRFDIIRMPISDMDIETSETILSNIEASETENFLFYEGKIVSIEYENLQSILKIYSIGGKELYSYRPQTPSTLFYSAYIDEHGILEFSETQHLFPCVKYSLTLDDFILKKIDDIKPPEWTSEISITKTFATSKDGIEIPLTILHRTDLELNGQNPTILYGYGGFGVCQTPCYDNFNLWWVKNGGVYAIAHPRGDGGWKGYWAEAGARNNKQNTFDDFIACTEYLLDENYTKREILISRGESNGGMTVTVAMQQRPELYAAVISQVPVLDILNHSMSIFNGDKTRWIDDYGTPYIFEDYESILSYSPLHNIKDNIKYPPIFLMATGKDIIAHPGNTLKFLATSQDRAGFSSAYLYYKPDGGHFDIFKSGQETDFNSYAYMISFIRKFIGNNRK